MIPLFSSTSYDLQAEVHKHTWAINTHARGEEQLALPHTMANAACRLNGVRRAAVGAYQVIHFLSRLSTSPSSIPKEAFASTAD